MAITLFTPQEILNLGNGVINTVKQSVYGLWALCAPEIMKLIDLT